MEKLKEILLENKKKIEDRISELYDDSEFQSMCKYALVAGGKRLRPVLFLESYKAFSTIDEMAIDFATSIELIHNYSLVHDDLPEMDDDKYRRGNLSVYGKYGQTNAVLVGDELLNDSANLIFNTLSKVEDVVKIKNGLRAANLIFNSSGKEGMILGQYFDLKDDEKNLKDIEFINYYKTGALFIASIVGGATLAGASNEDIEALEIYSKSIGLSFQLQDDLFDYEEDKRLNKKTAVTLMGVEETKRKINELNYVALDSLEKVKGNVEFFKNFIEFLKKREY